jgi:predicted MPP superfamily phosphohydrolase
MLRKYNEHVTLLEKKDLKAEKTAIEKKIMKLFKEQPVVKAKSDNWPDAKGIYSLSNIKDYVGEDNSKTDQVFHDMRNEDKKIKSIQVKILAYNEKYTYYYYEDHLSKEQVEKYKEEMEKSQKFVKPKRVKQEVPERKVARKKVAAKPRVPREKKAPTEADAKKKAQAYVRRKK